MVVATYAKEHHIKFAFHIASEYWIETYSDKYKNILPYADFLFGNLVELKALAKILSFESWDTEEWIKFVASYKPEFNEEENNHSQSRLVLISMDKNGAILDNYSFITGIHEIIIVPSVKIEDHEVVDESCAGDTFVGGFLSGYLSGKDLKSSVKDGHELASKVIQNIGWVFE